jgi:hypothetical protein
MQLAKIVHDKQTSAFLSFLIGLGVAILLFHKPFQYKQKLGMPVHSIEGRPIRHGDKCFSYRTQDAACPISKNKIVE